MVLVKENDNQFQIDFKSGQKTGFFIDQRENRKLLATYSTGKKVLNTFCYTGGFSVYATKANAAKVVSVDSSEKAMVLTDQNIALNGGEAIHESVTSDVFDYLKTVKRGDFDIIVLDPPAFAKNVAARHHAIQAYKRINLEAFQKLEKGGILFTFSCSQVVNYDLFKGAVTAAAIEAGKNIRILHQLTQPPDHPINIFHPEGNYLKGMVLLVN
jgi:23S rRNA (cytosine1962-C5)-methyltransferase